MNSRFRAWVILWALQVALLACGESVRAEDAVPGERRLPRDVVAYVSFRSIADLREQWPRTLTGRLTQDESLADFRAAVMERIGDASQGIEEKVGLRLSELLEVPHGELTAAAVIQPDGKPAAILLLDFGDRAESVQKLIEKLHESAQEKDLKRSEEEFEDTKLIVYRAAAENDNAPAHDAVAYCIKETLLVVGSSEAALKAVINRWDGKHENVLAENKVFRYLADTCRGENQDAAPLVTWYIDPLGLVKAALAAQPQANPQAGMVLGMLPLLGVDKFKGIGGTFDMARGGFDMVSRTLVYFEPPIRGLLNVFQFEAGAQTPPRWATAKSSSYFVVNWNIAKAYVAVESFWDSFQGAGATARLIQQLAENEAAGGMHLKRDIIDHLTGKVHVVGEPSGDEDGEEETYLVAAEVKNAAGARATLRKIAQVPGVQVKERDFQGETIYEIEVPDGDPAAPMGIAVAENHLMFSTDVKRLERVLRGGDGQETLADSSGFRRVAEFFPEKTASIGYNQEENPLQSLLAFLESPAAWRVLGSDASELTSKLPSGDELKKYAAPSGSYMEIVERGLKITSFSLKKEPE